ncbi:prepilin-type N-terminal cleavage/methylation domain-containing protein [Oleomonas cavernae]|uniref:Prepilin-type N-terminal cleavage/methylation domain-containing protein n=1 Tax=Oleomonas cavernae TaxID=2320859 RepID=A0A418VUI1_9PROT|nr:prepilin-type N-terminal cleavage/methylation domain-containing protein [Oleomonas cavernae]
MARPEANGGFSLVELLVVLVLLGLIGVLTAGSLRFGQRVWEGVAANSEQAQAARQTLEQVRAVIAGAVPVWLDPKGIRGGFDGEADHLSLRGQGPDGLASYQLAIGSDGMSRNTLTIKSVSLLGPGGVETRASAGEIRAVAFAYRADEIKPGQWLSRWKPEWPLPDLVRLRFAGETPDLIIRVAITHRSPCAVIPSPSGCPQEHGPNQ